MGSIQRGWNRLIGRKPRDQATQSAPESSNTAPESYLSTGSSVLTPVQSDLTGSVAQSQLSLAPTTEPYASELDMQVKNRGGRNYLRAGEGPLGPNERRKIVYDNEGYDNHHEVGNSDSAPEDALKQHLAKLDERYGGSHGQGHGVHQSLQQHADPRPQSKYSGQEGELQALAKDRALHGSGKSGAGSQMSGMSELDAESRGRR
jgi:hypothetical protein